MGFCTHAHALTYKTETILPIILPTVKNPVRCIVKNWQLFCQKFRNYEDSFLRHIFYF